MLKKILLLVLCGENIGFATTTTQKPHGNSPLIVRAVTILLRRGRVRFSPMLRFILFVLHWTRTPIIACPVSRVFIPNLAHVNQEWKLTNTLVIHNLLHFRSQVVHKLYTFGTFTISSSNLAAYSATIMFPYLSSKNSISFLFLTSSRKYFSKNTLLKTSQVTS